MPNDTTPAAGAADPMSLSLPPWAPEFRHVVFRDALPAQRSIRNLSPSHRETARFEEPCDLTGEEERFLRWLFRECGLDLHHYRLRTIKRRIPSCLRVLHASSCAEARRVLERKPGLMVNALSGLIIGVSSFFRDPGVFQALEAEHLPSLLESRAGLTIWSAGCSDGHELYSFAMLLAERGILDRCHLLGTDCRGDAIRRARDGVFDEDAVRGLSGERLQGFFTPASGKWRIREEVRAATHWRKADVLSLHEPGVWDIIACRNMAMYMSPEAITELWRRLEASLRPGGLLVLGRAERPTGARNLSPVGPCVYRRDRG